MRGPEDRNQRLLALSTIVNTVGMGMFLSSGTIFLIRSAGLSPTAAGVGLTVGSLCGFGAGVLIGDQADRRGAREVVIGCMLVEAAASVSLLLVHSLWSLLIVATAAAAALHSANPGTLDHCLLASLSPEPGHAKVAEQLGLRPLLDFGIGHGEGVGAALAAGIVKAAALTSSGMAVAVRR